MIALDSLDIDISAGMSWPGEGYIPDSQVGIMMIDQRRDAAVGVDLEILGALVLALLEVKVNALVREPEVLKYEDDFPRSQKTEVRMMSSLNTTSRYSPAVGTPAVGVEGELLAVRHSECSGRQAGLREDMMAHRLIYRRWCVAIILDDSALSSSSFVSSIA